MNLEDIIQRIVLDASGHTRGAAQVIDNLNTVGSSVESLTASLRSLTTASQLGRGAMVSDDSLSGLRTARDLLVEVVRLRKQAETLGGLYPGELSGTRRPTSTELSYVKGELDKAAIINGVIRERGATTSERGIVATELARLQALRAMRGGWASSYLDRIFGSETLLERGATPAELARIRQLQKVPFVKRLSKSALQALGEGEDEEPTGQGVMKGLHPYYLMHQFHTAWVELGNTIMISVRGGLTEVSSLVAHGVQAGMAGIGHLVAQALHGTFGFGQAIGGGIGGIGAALGGGISRIGAAQAQFQGGIFGNLTSGAGNALTAGLIFGPYAAAASAAVSGANMVMEYAKMKVETSLASLATAFHVALSTGGALAGTVVELGERFISLGAHMERSRVSISAFASGSSDLFENLLLLSRQMPLYSFSQLTDQMKVLVSEGVPLDNVIGLMQQLGDVAHGDEAIFHRASLAFGEMFAEGFISARRLRQLASIGVGAGDLAETMGIPLEEFQAKIHGSHVSLNVLFETMNRLTGQGGRYFGQNSQQLQTLGGQWKRLHTIIEQTFGRVGESMIQRLGLKDMVEKFANFIEANFEKIQSVALAIADRIKAGWEVTVEFLRAGWSSISDAIGLSGKSIEEALPSLDQFKSKVRDIIDYLLEGLKAFLGVLKEGLSNSTTSIRGKGWGQTAIDLLFPAVGAGQSAIDYANQEHPMVRQLRQFAGVGASRAISLIEETQRRFRRGGNADFFGDYASPDTPGSYRFPLRPEYTPEATQALEKWQKSLGEGSTQANKFFKQMDYIKELMGPMKRPEGFVGPLGMPGPSQIKAVQEGFFDLIDQGLRNFRGPAESMTGPAYFGSKEAVDIINKSNASTSTFQDRVLDFFEQMKQDQIAAQRIREKTNELLQQMVDQQPAGG